MLGCATRVDRCFDGRVVLLEIARAFPHPIKFSGEEFIRVGSYKKRLKEFPEKERALWRVLDHTPFESCVAAEHVSEDEVRGCSSKSKYAGASSSRSHRR